MKVWHIHNGGCSRAFARPTTFKECVILYFRGYRKFSPYWWSKPSNSLKQALKNGTRYAHN